MVGQKLVVAGMENFQGEENLELVLQQDSLFSRHAWCWFEGGQNFLTGESSGNRKGRPGQTCSKGKILVSGLV